MKKFQIWLNVNLASLFEIYTLLFYNNNNNNNGYNNHSNCDSINNIFFKRYYFSLARKELKIYSQVLKNIKHMCYSYML